MAKIPKCGRLSRPVILVNFRAHYEIVGLYFFSAYAQRKYT